MMHRIFALFVLWGSVAMAQSAKFVASGEVPPDQRDREGETIGAIGSAAAYDAKADTFFFATDRGPGDGTVDFRPRVQEARVKVSGRRLELEFVSTILLRDPSGRFLTGLTPDSHEQDHPQMRDGRWCIDPEGIALAPDGTLYLSDEYGPFLYQFRRDGAMLRFLRPPAEYLPRTADGSLEFGEEGKLVSGRVVNRGFEGLTLSPDGTKAFMILQSGLVQDGGKDSPTTRILCLDLASGKSLGEYRYPFDQVAKVKQDDLSVSELQALNDHEFLVLERDNRGADGSDKAKKPRHKVIYRIDLSRPGEKKLVADLVAAGAVFGDGFAAKWEGLALSPAGLLVTSDNDFLFPRLMLGGKEVSFPKAKLAQATQLLLFDLNLR